MKVLGANLVKKVREMYRVLITLISKKKNLLQSTLTKYQGKYVILVGINLTEGKYHRQQTVNELVLPEMFICSHIQKYCLLCKIFLPCQFNDTTNCINIPFRKLSGKEYSKTCHIYTTKHPGNRIWNANLLSM